MGVEYFMLYEIRISSPCTYEQHFWLRLAC